MTQSNRILLPLAGVIGWPISHSRSPYLHEYWLNHYNLSGAYVALPVEGSDLKQVLETLPKCGFVGANVTIPHKESAFLLADQATETAKRLQAANTLYFQDGLITADNTDGFGFTENIHQAIPDYDWTQPALVVGAGGASRAIVDALLHKGAKTVYLTNRTFERCKKLASDFGNPENLILLDWSDKENVNPELGLIVNTTSLGMAGAAPTLEFAFDRMHSTCIVTDVVYTPLETEFLKNAKHHGLKTIDGLGMLLHQARPGFQKWFGAGFDPVVDEELRSRVLA